MGYSGGCYLSVGMKEVSYKQFIIGSALIAVGNQTLW